MMNHPMTHWSDGKVEPNDLKWRLQPFEQLTPHALYALMRLRVDVFVVEQNCPYPELDGADELAQHVQGFSADGLVAYARILPPDEQQKVWIGRVVVAAPARRTGAGRALMLTALQWAQNAYPQLPVWLGAQVSSQAFYEGLGFKVAGEPYLEDDIPHVPMSMPV